MSYKTPKQMIQACQCCGVVCKHRYISSGSGTQWDGSEVDWITWECSSCGEQWSD